LTVRSGIEQTLLFRVYYRGNQRTGVQRLFSEKTSWRYRPGI